MEVKVASVDMSRDIEESARSPTIVNEVRAATAVVYQIHLKLPRVQLPPT